MGSWEANKAFWAQYPSHVRNHADVRRYERGRMIATAIQDFCTRVYEATCANPSRIVLPAVAFDTLAADVDRRCVFPSEDTWRPGVVILETGHGERVVIDRGRA